MTEIYRFTVESETKDGNNHEYIVLGRGLEDAARKMEEGRRPRILAVHYVGTVDIE